MRSMVEIAGGLLVLALSATPVMASENDPEGSYTPVGAHQDSQPRAIPSGGSFDEGDASWSGGGRGELPAPSARNDGDDQRARDEAAVLEYNHQSFLNDTWSKP